MALTAKIREEVKASGPCDYCGDEFPTQVDHIIPLSRGGTDDRNNLAPSCRGCNMEKLDFTPDEYKEYRIEAGLGWPPQSRTDFIAGLLAEAKARDPAGYEAARKRFMANICTAPEE